MKHLYVELSDCQAPSVFIRCSCCGSLPGSPALQHDVVSLDGMWSKQLIVGHKDRPIVATREPIGLDDPVSNLPENKYLKHVSNIPEHILTSSVIKTKL